MITLTDRAAAADTVDKPPTTAEKDSYALLAAIAIPERARRRAALYVAGMWADRCDNPTSVCADMLDALGLNDRLPRTYKSGSRWAS